MNQTVRLDDVPFQYNFCKYFSFIFNFFFSKQWRTALTFMNFAKQIILTLSNLN